MLSEPIFRKYHRQEKVGNHTVSLFFLPDDEWLFFSSNTICRWRMDRLARTMAMHAPTTATLAAATTPMIHGSTVFDPEILLLLLLLLLLPSLSLLSACGGWALPLLLLLLLGSGEEEDALDGADNDVVDKSGGSVIVHQTDQLRCNMYSKRQGDLRAIDIVTAWG